MISEILPEALAGERLDRVISMLDGCSRSVAATMISEGQVQVDDRTVKQRSFRVAAGMQVAFTPSEPEAAITVGPDETVPFEVVHVDDDLVIIDKPPGVVVHPGAGRPDGTLANGLVARFPEIADVGDSTRPGIVHRLDADTSGLLCVARTQAAYEPLVAALSAHRVERIYSAVVAGLVTDDRGTIDAPLGRSTKNRTKMAVVADGRWAKTHYEVLDRSTQSESTLLRCELETGRTHQIRVHLAAIGHHVVGDTLYGPRAGVADIDRVALHAHRLGLLHPITDEALSFEAPLPSDYTALLQARSLTP